MKFSTTTLSLLSLLAVGSSGSVEAHRHAGIRRSVDFAGAGNVRLGSSTTHLQKRMPLGAEQPKMMKSVKRAPLYNNDQEKRELESEPVAFGSIPVFDNSGMGSITGLTERSHIQKRAWSHDGKQGSKSEVSTSSDSSDSSNTNSSASSASTSSDDGDDEECDEDDEEDDDEECEEDDDDDEEEDCEEEDEDDSSSSSSSSSTSDSATATVQNNWKQSSPSSSSSASASSNTQASSTSSASSAKNTGTATWFTQNGNAGNCGQKNPDSAKLIALYSGVYDGGANCGRKVLITNLQDGGSVEAFVADSCPTCGGPEDIDLSVGAMSAIDPNYKTNGIRKIEWHYIS